MHYRFYIAPFNCYTMFGSLFIYHKILLVLKELDANILIEIPKPKWMGINVENVEK